ncbi:MAG TPA: DUF1326 domain-containing protein [Acetobacteraceae bacterium]|nr:DUF1326 domain-containing protein [Acetobacteraceae bacterium]
MTEWKLNGTYFETCNCEAACPCVFTSPPTEGDCTALVAWHIREGSFGETRLDGLNVALAIHAPGTMVETKWKVAAYFDDRASQPQNDALHQIFGGKAGGHPAVLASFIGEILGARSVPMHFEGTGKNASLTIPGIAAAAIEVMTGQGGEPITISNHPLAVAPGEPATVARSTQFRFADFGMDWTLSGRNGFLSPFTYMSA